MANSEKSGHDDEAADAEAKVVFRMVDPGLSENDSEGYDETTCLF